METSRFGADTRDKLIGELKLVIREAEEMLRNTGQQMDQGYQQARARFESTLSDAKSSLSNIEDRFMSDARDAVDTADQYVQEHPWQSVGIGAVAGLIIGLWLGRR